MDKETPEASIDAQVALVQAATRRANLFRSHRNLYLVLMTFALMNIALAVNFWFGPKPTFNPYHIDRRVIGTIFAALGITKIVVLNIYRNLRLVRATLAVGFSFTMFWGISNTEQAFAGRASFQLPILYITLAALKFPLLIEPSTNPMSRKLHEKTE